MGQDTGLTLGQDQGKPWAESARGPLPGFAPEQYVTVHGSVPPLLKTRPLAR